MVAFEGPPDELAGLTMFLDEQRAAILDFLRAARAGEPAGEKKWLPRYGARRIAWHALDHAWEMQDRTPA